MLQALKKVADTDVEWLRNDEQPTGALTEKAPDADLLRGISALPRSG